MSAALPQVRTMQIIFGLLAVQFLLPGLSYLFTPQVALSQAVALGSFLGGGEYPLAREGGPLFRVLAAGNVFTLGVLCLLMLLDMRKYHPLIPVFVVLKGFSAVAYLYIYFTELRYPLFWAAFLWDGLAVFLVVFFGSRARAALESRPQGTMLG